MPNTIIIAWNDRLSVGVETIDKQHKHLVALTNQLYQACVSGHDDRYDVFNVTMSRVVEYIRFHFASEQALFQRINYPYYAEHKSEHDDLILQVLEYTKNYSDKKRFIPNNFVRFLRDWITSHIGHSDKKFGIYIVDQIKKGLLSERDINP